METDKKLQSLTIFFPFYNDEGTVLRQIDNAYIVGNRLTNDLEVIALHGGNSKDNTYKEICDAQQKHQDLRIIDKRYNSEGYAVIKHGFATATKKWVFYTDGDAQYHLEEDLEKLVNKLLNTNANVINGYKLKRGDSFVRIVLGDMYRRLSRVIFKLPIRDVDCDFRLIKKDLLNKIKLESSDSSILPELIKKLEKAGGKFAEAGVSHYERCYGYSSYRAMDLFVEKIKGDMTLYLKMRKMKLL